MIWMWFLGCGEQSVVDSGQPTDTILASAVAGEDIYVTLGEPITLDATGSSGISLEWNLGDGSIQTGSAIEHTYADIGRKRVVLTATGESGSTDSDILNVVVHNPLLTTKPQSNHPMVILEDAIWIVLPESNAIHRLPLEESQRPSTIELCAEPTSIAQYESQLVVTCSGDARIALLDIETEVPTLSFIDLPTGYRPSAVLSPTDNDTILYWWIVDSATGQLGHMLWGESISWQPIGNDLKGIARHSDGTLLLPEFRSSATTAELHTWHPETNIVDTIVLEMDPFGDSDNTTGGIPNLLNSVYPSPDGQRIYTPYLHANIVRGQYLSQQNLTHETSLRGILGHIDWTTQSESVDSRKHFDEKGRASGMEYSTFGDVLYVLHPGVAQLSVIDAFSHQIVGSVSNLGLNPTDIQRVDEHLYIYSWLTREIIAVSIVDPLRPELVWQRSFIESEPLNESVLWGKQLFHDASDPRMTRTGYIACAHCHPNGDDDGQTWDFTDRGEGLRNTTSLWGRGSMDMGPFHWSGNFDEVQDFENDIRLHFGGSGFLTEENWDLTQDTLGESKATLSPELDALAAYLYSLSNTPQSPFSIDSDAFDEARQTFDDIGCNECHNGDFWTDSSLSTFVRHDVGTLTEASGQRMGTILDGLDTPTLLGLWDSAPYLHDGSAATLEDAIRAHIGYEDMDEETLSQLIALLESL